MSTIRIQHYELKTEYRRVSSVGTSYESIICMHNETLGFVGMVFCLLNIEK